MRLGEKIKALRTEKRLTQEELAEAVGTKKQTIHKYETGIITNIPASKIKLIADVLNTTPAYLMGWEDSDNKSDNNESELEEYLEELRTRPEMKMLFNLTKNATKEDVEKAVKIIEMMLEK